jgi:predicted  nucleic acid-binding Zn-ribbon protein
MTSKFERNFMLVLSDLFPTDPPPTSTLDILTRQTTEISKHVERLNESLTGVLQTLETLDVQITALETQIARQQELFSLYKDTL